jgi:hypothetical protein
MKKVNFKIKCGPGGSKWQPIYPKFKQDSKQYKHSRLMCLASKLSLQYLTWLKSGTNG